MLQKNQGSEKRHIRYNPESPLRFLLGGHFMPLMNKAPSKPAER
jgi:hypothetical protein